ncbi:hypothetical protein FRC19_003221 [Serendipita sp. 401]|nr:hypothetical protein FRC19_003221 [Serendipita sp. 401]
MASLFHALFSCCLGERKKDDESTAPLLQGQTVHIHGDPIYYNTGDPYGNDAEELHQKVAEIVNNGTDQMLAAGFLPPTASSSHLPTASSVRPPSFSAGNGNFHSSQYSNSSSRPESLQRPHLLQSDADPPTWEDGTQGIDHPQSFSDANTPYRNNISTYGTFGTGTTFAGRRPFKIHRGRPPSTKRPLPNGAGIGTQANGVLSPGEPADENQSHRPTRRLNHVDPPLPSPPLQIRPINNEVANAERRQVHFELPPEELIVHYD